jgi:hypothetical protein
VNKRANGVSIAKLLLSKLCKPHRNCLAKTICLRYIWQYGISTVAKGSASNLLHETSWERNPILSTGILSRAPSPPDPNPADFRRSGIELRFYIVAPVSKFEVQIYDTAQYCGKKAPHGKKATV